MERGLTHPPPHLVGAPALQVEALQARPGAPHVIIIRKDLHFGRQAERLVASADAVVLPYVGGTWERSALWPLSCGRPIVTTAGGPAADVVTDHNGYLVPASGWGPCGPEAPSGPAATDVPGHPPAAAASKEFGPNEG